MKFREEVQVKQYLSAGVLSHCSSLFFKFSLVKIQPRNVVDDREEHRESKMEINLLMLIIKPRIEILLTCLRVDQTRKCIKISSNFIQWFDYYHQVPGMESVVSFPFSPIFHSLL